MDKDIMQGHMEKLKKDLKKYHTLKKNVDRFEELLFRIDNKLQSLGGFSTDERIQTTKDPDKWTELISKKIEIQNDINKKLMEGYEEMARIEKLIESLDEDGKLLMRLKYIDCLTWEEVAVEMGYSWRHMHRIHGKCLKNVIECQYRSEI